MKRIFIVFLVIFLISGILSVSSLTVFGASVGSTSQNTSTFKGVSAGGSFTVVLKEDGTVVSWGGYWFNQCFVPEGLSNVKAIAAGAAHTVALKDDGSLVTWGLFYDDDSHYSSRPTVPDGLTDVKDIAAGCAYTVALKKDGTLAAFGENTDGQCTIPFGLSNVKSVAAGKNHTVALKEDGSIVAWGNNTYGQCTVPSGLTGVKAIAAGENFTVALKEDGTVVAWGDNSKGQCKIPDGLTDVESISAKWMHTVAIEKGGAIVAWGDNSNGQCNIPAGLNGVKAVSAGYIHSVALKEDGTLAAWGDNLFGKCIIPANESGIKSIAVGAAHTVALEENGTVIAWGHNECGQCTVPSNITGVKAICAGGAHSAALKDDGTVIAWGYNEYGQCTIPSGLSGVKAIAAGDSHTVALKKDGTVVAWGDNSKGQCSIPSSLSGVKAIAAGSFHTVALKEDGTVVVWGDNSNNQCLIPNWLPEVKAIAAGGLNTAVLCKDGKVVVWGIHNVDYIPIENITFGVKAISVNSDCVLMLGEDGVLYRNDFYSIYDSYNGITRSFLPGVKEIAASEEENKVILSVTGSVIGSDTNRPFEPMSFIIPFQKASSTNLITPSVTEFDPSNPQDINVQIGANSDNLLAVKINNSVPLTSADYNVSDNIVTIRKSYLSYYFNKYSSPSQKLSLTFDFDDGVDQALTVSRTVISNYIKCDKPTFDFSNPQDITVSTSGAPIKAVLINTTPLTSADYNISGNVVTIKKSYLSYFFNKLDSWDQKLALTFDFQEGNDVVFTVTRESIENRIEPNNAVFDPSNPHDIMVYVSGSSPLNNLMINKTPLTRADYSVPEDSVQYYYLDYYVTIKKSYLSYYFNKYNSPDQKLVLTFDFASKNDPALTISRALVTNNVKCDNPVYDPSNPQDITINTSGASIKAVLINTTPLTNVDYSINGNIVTIKKSYLKYYFNKFTSPGISLNLTFDFADGNDPLFTVSRRLN